MDVWHISNRIVHDRCMCKYIVDVGLISKPTRCKHSISDFAKLESYRGCSMRNGSMKQSKFSLIDLIVSFTIALKSSLISICAIFSDPENSVDLISTL